MKKIWVIVAGLAAFSLLAAADLGAQGRGKGPGGGKKKPPVKRDGDNRDDVKSGKSDRPGDGNSGQGDDLHRKRRPNKEGKRDGDRPKKDGEG